MASQFLELLRRSDLLRRGKPGLSVLNQCSKRRLMDVAEQSMILTSTESLGREKGIWASAASISLSGGPHPCSRLECRLQRANNLAQFAALYSDKVYIYNAVAKYCSDHYKPANTHVLRWHLHDDLTLLGFLGPLIDAGIVVPITPAGEHCPFCFSRRTEGLTEARRGKAAFDWLRREYKVACAAAVHRVGTTYCFHIKGPERLLEHGFVAMQSDTVLPEIEHARLLLARVRRGETVPLSKTAWKQMPRLHRELASSVFTNAQFDSACSMCLGTTFLTDNPLDIEVLNRLSPDSPLRRRNQILQKHLHSLVPFLECVKIADLVSLRHKEGEALKSFRAALGNAVDLYRDNLDHPFSDTDARQLYGDVIEPKLARLNTQLKAARRKFVTVGAAKAASWVGAIAFGVTTSLLPADLAKLASILGFTQVLAELGAPLLQSSVEPPELRANDMYFLWRVQKLAGKRGRQANARD